MIALASEPTPVTTGAPVFSSNGILVGRVSEFYEDRGEGAGGLEARRPGGWVVVAREPDGQGGRLYVPLSSFLSVEPTGLTLDAPYNEVDNRDWIYRPAALAGLEPRRTFRPPGSWPPREEKAGQTERPEPADEA